MSEVKTNLPQVRVEDPNLQRLLDSLTLVLKTWNGETGNELDKVITYRDLVQDTSIATAFNEALRAGIPGGIQTGGDLTIPPQLSNLVVGSGPTKNVLSWEGTGTGSYSYTEVWRNTSDDLGTAELNGTTEAEVFSDDVGTIAVDYYYWVRGISTGGTPGPFNQTGGTMQTLSAVDTAHIADAAIVTAKIGDAQITTAKIGALQVDTANIADAAIENAKVANAAIGTANIIDANITTLKVAGRNITNPVSAYTASVASKSTSVTSGGGATPTSWSTSTIQSAAITIDGGEPVLVSQSFRRSYTTTSGVGPAFRYRLTRDTTDLIVTSWVSGASGLADSWVAFNISDTPSSSGTYTYYVYIDMATGSMLFSGAGTHYHSNRSLTLIEAKR